MFVANGRISFFLLWLNNIASYACMHFLYPFIHGEIRRLFPCLSDCEYCCSEHGSADISSRYDFFSFRYILSRAPPILEIFPIWGSRGLLSMEDAFVPYVVFPWTPG